MSSKLKLPFRYFFGPTLYSYPTDEGSISLYNPNVLEKYSNHSIHTINFCCGIIKWTFLFWGPFHLFRKTITVSTLQNYLQYAGFFISIYFVLHSVRFIGRSLNGDYRHFIDVLFRAREDPTPDKMSVLRRYDFDFSHWPRQFDINKLEKLLIKPADTIVEARVTGNFFTSFFSKLLIKTFGIRLAYPGCTGIIAAMVGDTLRTERRNLQEKHQILRTKLVAANGHEVETFYVDRRKESDNPLGKILVISCEGNAGFPEVGGTLVPLKLQYSVIGWHHPGFGGSTGLPFPKDEVAAMDAVLQFAFSELKFSPEDVIIYAWSIGGYTATWAGMKYPRIRSLILDATFDNLDMLAEKALPSIFYAVTLTASQLELDLNNGGQIVKYPGPIRLIRRTRDEMITTSREPDLGSNRGNALLQALLQHRYPYLNKDEESRMMLYDFFQMNSENRNRLLPKDDIEKSENDIRLFLEAYGKDKLMTYPCDLGKSLPLESRTRLLLYLMTRYMDDFDATHCSPIKEDFFKEGWKESDTFK